MVSLDWQNPDDTPPEQESSDPWFGIAMGLLGVIVGLILFRLTH